MSSNGSKLENELALISLQEWESTNVLFLEFFILLLFSGNDDNFDVDVSEVSNN